MKKFISNKHTYILGIILLIIIWKLLFLLIGQGTMVFPGPFSTIKYLIYLLEKEYTYRCIFYTMMRMLYGYILSVIFGLLFGILAGNDVFFERLFAPTITCLRAIPTASLIYLFIVLAGFKYAPSYLVCLVSFPIIYEGVVGGFKNIPVEINNASKVDGAHFLKSLFRIKFPFALTYIFISMVSSFSLCFKIEIMAEVITGASLPGLGSAILGARSNNPTDMVPIFAYSLIAILIMIVIDYFINIIKTKISESSL